MRPWICGVTPEEFGRRLRDSSERAAGRGGPVLIAEREPADFLAGVFGSLLSGRTVALGNPDWGERERREAEAVLRGARGAGRAEILIPTGGSAGSFRFARHSWGTLAAAAEGFAAFFGVDRVESLCVLPLFHVSGLMQAVRSLVTGGIFYPLEWKLVEAGSIPDVPGGFLSLVPTQLRRVLESGAELDRWRKLRAIPLGGAAAPPDLLEAADAARLPVALSYGMTETAAMVTATLPEEFLRGCRDCGGALPHAEFEVRDGEICIRASSLFLGYAPGGEEREEWWATGDAGEMIGGRRLRVIGRKGRWVVSGGEKISLEEVDAAVGAVTGVREVFSFGVEDAEWGEILAVAFVAEEEVDLRAALRGRLANHKIPKLVYPLAELPRTAAGKIDRGRLLEICGRRIVPER